MTTAAAVIGSPGDPQASRVAEALARRGASVVQVDAPAFPDGVRMSLGTDAEMLEGAALPPIAAAYVRGLGYNPLSPRFETELLERPRGLVAQCGEKRAFLRAWLARLEADGCVLVNSLEANDQHAEKPRQLALLERAGVPVPSWLATNDPGAVRDFAAAGPCVFKPLAGGASVHAVMEEDLTDERLEALALAPVLFQRRVDGLALRVFVVDDAVIGAAAIHSDALDYRGNESKVEAVALTPTETDTALRAAQACGMVFSGVDLIRTEAGTSWLLECNPSPMFAALEDATGLEVAEAVAGYLAGVTKCYGRVPRA